MIDKDTGYIKLGDFSETSDDELGDALKKLNAQGMKRLVFDLRDNPGGPLDQAIRIANRFLPAGRHDRLHARPHAELRPGLPRHRRQPTTRTCRWWCWSTATAPARRRSSPARCRITTARSSSARRRSARRWCSRSTGSAKAPGLALTTGRYYTPSGRMIQRPWDGTFDEYLTYTLRDQNAQREHAAARAQVHRRRPQGLQRRRHRAGQVLRRPGRRLQPDALRPRRSWAGGAFANFADQFTAEGDTRLSAANKNKKRARQAASPSPTRWSRTSGVRCKSAEGRRSTRPPSRKDDDLHPGDDPLRHRRRALRHRRSAQEPDRKDPQAQFALSQFAEAVQLTTAERTAGNGDR